jgi:hypothetical protein
MSRFEIFHSYKLKTVFFKGRNKLKNLIHDDDDDDDDDLDICICAYLLISWLDICSITRAKSAGKVTGYRLNDQCSIFGSTKISLFATTSRQFLCHTHSPMWAPANFYPGVKRPKRDTDDPVISSAKVKNT